MISTFPDGISGLGLLILRSALGIALALGALTYLHDRNNGSPVIVTVILLMVLTALLIVIGYRTRITAIAGMAAMVAGMMSCTGEPVFEKLDIWTMEVFAIAIAAAIACVGPGVFSLDSRLFGRREIVIPKSPQKLN
jgi:uncharacterized membrane protein YphA (DoxX/SURF4 family)